MQRLHIAVVETLIFASLMFQCQFSKPGVEAGAGSWGSGKACPGERGEVVDVM